MYTARPLRGSGFFLRRPCRARTDDLLDENQVSFADSSNGPWSRRGPGAPGASPRRRALPRCRTENLRIFTPALLPPELEGREVGRQDSNLHLRCVGGLCQLSYGQEGSVQLRVAGASRQGLSPVRCTGRRWHAVRPLLNTAFATVHRPSRSGPGGADWAAPSVLTTAATRGGPPGHVRRQGIEPCSPH